MEAKFIAKDKWPEFVKGLQGSYEVLGPVQVRDHIAFRPFEKVEDLVLGGPLPKRAPKEFFFPQSEAMFRYHQNKEKYFHYEPVEDPTVVELKPRVLLGVSPCDAGSFAILDKVFDNEDYRDSYWVRLRKATRVVSFTCGSPRKTCFCTSYENGGPAARDGSDMVLTDLGKAGYLAEAITDEGAELVKDCAAATDEHRDDAKEIKDKATALACKDFETVKALPEKMKGLFENEVWESIHEKCISCGTCTYMCPTCHCFDIQDEFCQDKGCRYRNWDSCMFPIFTLHTTGHNPRTQGAQRWRQRMMHKFSYYVDNFKEIACVGCGRCITNCPVNVDIREIIKELDQC